jgi:hypothetical protein
MGIFNGAIAGLVPEAHATNSSSETIRKPFDLVLWNNNHLLIHTLSSGTTCTNLH